MGKKSRTKGATFENMVCGILRPISQGVCRNLDQYQKSSGRDLSNFPYLSIQCKNHKNITKGKIMTALAEAENAADDEYKIPVAVTKSDRGPTLITLELDWFVTLWQWLEDGDL